MVSLDEALCHPAVVEQQLGLGRAGGVLRNLLVEANANQSAWAAIQDSIDRLMGCTLQSPDTSGPNILAKYTAKGDGGHVDIATAGRGVQQVLMLLAVLNLYDGAVLLLDNPDAHLYGPMLGAVHHELRAVAARKRSQLIIATHSEVIINAVEPGEVCVLRRAGEPKMAADTAVREHAL